jgi:hypothetical protein
MPKYKVAVGRGGVLRYCYTEAYAQHVVRAYMPLWGFAGIYIQAL